MRRLLLGGALSILAWDSVAELLEIRYTQTGITEQRLYHDGGQCEPERAALAAKPGFNRTFIMADCSSQVWLPWEPGAPKPEPSSPWFGVSP